MKVFYQYIGRGVYFLKRLMTAFILIVGLLSGCDYPFNNTTYEGHIIEKRDYNGLQILVIQNITKEDIKQKSKEQLLLDAAANSTSAIYFFVKKGIYKKVEVGDKVIVTYNKGQPAKESDPPQTSLNKLKVVEE